MSKILVTGAAGFIGSHICLVLLEKGYDIIGLDSFENSSPESLKRVVNIVQGDKVIKSGSLKVVEGDIRNKLFLKNVFEDSLNDKNPIDSVIHLAGLKSVFDSVQNPIKYWDYNVLGSLNLLDIMDSFNCRTIVFSSSATVYEQSNKL